MKLLVRDAMAFGAAGFSSTHSPTDFDVRDRQSNFDELTALAAELGRANRGSIAYLPFIAVAGLALRAGKELA